MPEPMPEEGAESAKGIYNGSIGVPPLNGSIGFGQGSLKGIYQGSTGV